MPKTKKKNLKQGKAGAASSGGSGKAGSPKQACPYATIVVTVVRDDGKQSKNFGSTIRLTKSGAADKTGTEKCDKPKTFGTLDPGKYTVSAKPADGFGYSFEKGVSVTVGAGATKNVKVTLKRAEIKSVSPSKDWKQYINLTEDASDLHRGREVLVEAKLTKKMEGVWVYFDLEFGDKNKTGLPKELRPFIPDRKKTDANGIAEVKFKLSRYGGDTFDVLASLNDDPKHPSANAKKSAKITVWRKTWYQVDHPKDTAFPNPKGFADSQEKVFLETAITKQQKFKKADFPVDPYRPQWQFQPGKGDTLVACIGTHNIGTVKALLDANPAGSKPKFHVALCDEQYDAKGLVTKVENVIFIGNANPKDFRPKVMKVSDGKVAIFDPPLQGGALIKKATYRAREKVGNNWVTRHSGTLPAANIVVRKARASKREVRVTPPAQCSGGGGCRCGGVATALAVDATHAIVVAIKLLAADGGYNGWAPRNSVVSVVRGGAGRKDYDVHNTMGHEMGHLFAQVRWKKINGLPDHPLFYQKRGGSGTHCAHGATWAAAALGTPALDPKKANELDAQGKGAGRWTAGDCIIFGYTVSKKREWCEHCQFELRVSDLSNFK